MLPVTSGGRTKPHVPHFHGPQRQCPPFSAASASDAGREVQLAAFSTAPDARSTLGRTVATAEASVGFIQVPPGHRMPFWPETREWNWNPEVDTDGGDALLSFRDPFKLGLQVALRRAT